MAHITSLSFRLRSLMQRLRSKTKNKIFKVFVMVLHSVNLWTILFILGILSRFSHCLHFELQSGQAKCISEDIKSNSMTVGKYSVVNPNEAHSLPSSHKIFIVVSSGHGNEYHRAENVESGQFAFTAVEGGDYMTCITAGKHKPEVKFSVDFDWRSGVQSKTWTSVAKKSQVEVMEIEVTKLIDTVNSIHEEMFYLRDREEEMQNLNRATNMKMAWLSFLSLFVCFGVAGMQFVHLKTFLVKKKVI